MMYARTAAARRAVLLPTTVAALLSACTLAVAAPGPGDGDDGVVRVSDTPRPVDAFVPASDGPAAFPADAAVQPVGMLEDWRAHRAGRGPDTGCETGGCETGGCCESSCDGVCDGGCCPQETCCGEVVCGDACGTCGKRTLACRIHDAHLKAGRPYSRLCRVCRKLGDPGACGDVCSDTCENCGHRNVATRVHDRHLRRGRSFGPLCPVCRRQGCGDPCQKCGHRNAASRIHDAHLRAGLSGVLCPVCNRRGCSPGCGALARVRGAMFGLGARCRGCGPNGCYLGSLLGVGADACGDRHGLIGSYSHTYAVDPSYNDPRTGHVYASHKTGVPMAVPTAPNVRYSYEYGWGLPSSRLELLSRPAGPESLYGPPEGVQYERPAAGK